MNSKIPKFSDEETEAIHEASGKLRVLRERVTRQKEASMRTKHKADTTAPTVVEREGIRGPIRKVEESSRRKAWLTACRTEYESYKPTREELLEIARYWTKETFWCEIYVHFYGCGISSGDHSRLMYAYERLKMLGAAIETGAVDAVVAFEWAEERMRMGEETWRLFTEGSEEERQRFRDEWNAADVARKRSKE
jgi:hypothetical protein